MRCASRSRSEWRTRVGVRRSVRPAASASISPRRRSAALSRTRAAVRTAVGLVEGHLQGAVAEVRKEDRLCYGIGDHVTPPVWRKWPSASPLYHSEASVIPITC